MSPIHLSNPFRRDPDAPTLKERGAALKAGIARVARKAAPPAPDLAPEPGPAGPVDWHNPPPGFMASPAIEPTSFANIATGIRIELERLRDIAQDEIDRVSGEVWEGAHETMRAGLENRLRRRFRLDEIKAALAPEMPVPAGIEADGLVYYEDAAGQTWRQSVAHWIGFTAQRLFSVARQERTRQFNAACNDLDPADCDELHTRLTKDLRIDALHALAFRSDKVFEAEEARRQGDEEPAPDPFLAAVGIARAANAAVDAFGRRTARSKPEGWFQEEQDLVAEQSRVQGIAMATVPTTQAGRIALAAYMAELMGRYGMADGGPPDPDSSIWADAYQTFSAALRTPIRAEVTEPDQTRGAGVGPSPQEEAACLDLSACSLREVCRLYEAFAATADRLSEAMCLPCFSKPLAQYPLSGVVENTPAGDILDDRQNRMAFLRDACADEILRRRPADDRERDLALTIRLQHELACEGKIRDRALLTDLAAAWGA